MVEVRIQFTAASHEEVIATFVDEEVYSVCLKALEEYAEENNGVILESIIED